MSETTETQPAAEDDPIAVRRAKREALIAAGEDPYGHAFAYSHHVSDLERAYGHLEDGESTEDAVSVAGRVMAKRDQGKLAFLELRDATGDHPAVLPRECAWRRRLRAAEGLGRG